MAVGSVGCSGRLADEEWKDLDAIRLRSNGDKVYRRCEQTVKRRCEQKV